MYKTIASLLAADNRILIVDKLTSVKGTVFIDTYIVAPRQGRAAARDDDVLFLNDLLDNLLPLQENRKLAGHRWKGGDGEMYAIGCLHFREGGKEEIYTNIHLFPNELTAIERMQQYQLPLCADMTFASEIPQAIGVEDAWDPVI